MVSVWGCHFKQEVKCWCNKDKILKNVKITSKETVSESEMKTIDAKKILLPPQNGMSNLIGSQKI